MEGQCLPSRNPLVVRASGSASSSSADATEDALPPSAVLLRVDHRRTARRTSVEHRHPGRQTVAPVEVEGLGARHRLGRTQDLIGLGATFRVHSCHRQAGERIHSAHHHVVSILHDRHRYHTPYFRVHARLREENKQIRLYLLSSCNNIN